MKYRRQPPQTIPGEITATFEENEVKDALITYAESYLNRSIPAGEISLLFRPHPDDNVKKVTVVLVESNGGNGGQGGGRS
jgi:hypothetical protein